MRLCARLRIVSKQPWRSASAMHEEIWTESSNAGGGTDESAESRSPFDARPLVRDPLSPFETVAVRREIHPPSAIFISPHSTTTINHHSTRCVTMQQRHILSNQSKCENWNVRLVLQLQIVLTMTTAICVLSPMSSTLAPCLLASIINSPLIHRQLLDLVMRATGGHSRALGRRSRSRRGSGSGGRSTTGGAGTGANVLAQDSLAGNGDGAALGLVASGSAAGDEASGAGGSGGGWMATLA